jgi:hypothetical protein
VLLAVPEPNRAVATVPADKLDAFSEVSPEPAPVTVVNVPTLAVKLPEASRATIVEAPLAEAAVVLALATVPVVIDVPFKAVKAEPFAVITFAVKLPEPSRATIVFAPFASVAVVRAFAKVPADILDALIAVILPPAPDKVINVPTLAEKLPFASRATIVEAPFADVAVVLAFGIVPALIVLAFSAVIGIVMSAEPLKLVAVPVAPPDVAIVLAVCNVVAFEAVPVKLAVTVPALKLPEASLATIVEAPLAEAAFDVTVNVLPPAWLAVNVAEPDKPVPEVFSVKVPSLAVDTVAQVWSPRK